MNAPEWQRPQGWLSPEDELDAKAMEQVVKEEWQPERDATPFVPHDLGHFRRVEDWIRRLIPREKWSDLSGQERRILTWCAWTHDIGMFRRGHPPDTPDSTIRERHVDVSAQWVVDNAARLKLTKLEAQIVADIDAVLKNVRRCRFNPRPPVEPAPKTKLSRI